MARISILTLRQLLDKAIFDHVNPYYNHQGHSVYKDGIIALRTNFYEPLLNQLYTNAYHENYKKYFQLNKSRNARYNSPDREKVKLFEKLVVVTHQGQRPVVDNSYKFPQPIFEIHNLYLNDAVHTNPLMTQNDYVRSYLEIQNFAVSYLNQDYSEQDIFKTTDEIKSHIITEVEWLGNGIRENPMLVENLKKERLELVNQIKLLELKLSLEKMSLEWTIEMHEHKNGRGNQIIKELEKKIDYIELQIKSFDIRTSEWTQVRQSRL